MLCAALWLGWERAAFGWRSIRASICPARSPGICSEGNRDGLRTFTERLWETVRSGTHAEVQARFHDALFFLGLCELSSSGESTVDKPLSTHDVKIARVTALFRTALANGHFALSDILDRHAEARREHQELLST